MAEPPHGWKHVAQLHIHQGSAREADPSFPSFDVVHRRDYEALEAELAAAQERELPSAEQIARLFHEAYERLAPAFGYETRKDSAVPWDEVPEANRALMVAVAGGVRAALSGERDRG